MPDSVPEWLFDESKPVGVDYTDAALVADYDEQHTQFRDFAQEAQKIVTALGLSEDSTVLDIGCGTGGLAICFAGLCRHVYAVDTSEAMIAAVKAKAEKHGLGNVTAIRSGFLDYRHEGEAPDAAVANITLHHLPDFWKQIALCRLHDVLRPGGKLFLADVVFGFNPRSYEEAISSWLAGMKNLAGQKLADESAVHVRDEFSTWDWVMTGMLERAGFKVDNDTQIMEHMRAYICFK